jgi:cytochrome P450
MRLVDAPREKEVEMISFAELLTTPPERIYDTYAALRDAGDGVFIDPPTGYGFVMRHADLDRIFRDVKTYSNDVYWKTPLPIYDPTNPVHCRAVSYVERFLLFFDAPAHTRLRALTAHAFTAQAVANMRSAIEAATDEILGQFEQGQEVDFATEVAVKLPAWAMASIMGIPKEDRDQFTAWTNPMSQTLEPSVMGLDRDFTYQCVVEFIDYFAELADRRRGELGDDLTSTLITAEEDGDRLTPDELVSIAFVLVAGGNASTTCLLNNGTKLLVGHPDQRALLADQPALLSSAIEEMLRYEAPVRWTSRVVKEPARIGDHDLKPDTYLWLGIGPANRDPRAFENPETFDITRTNNKHLCFAVGNHYCLGAGLTRLVASTFFCRLMNRFPAMVQTGDVTYGPHFSERVFKHFPVALN